MGGRLVITHIAQNKLTFKTFEVLETSKVLRFRQSPEYLHFYSIRLIMLFLGLAARGI